jgi:hypothetical protein
VSSLRIGAVWIGQTAFMISEMRLHNPIFDLICPPDALKRARNASWGSASVWFKTKYAEGVR